jgi:hypothetical protein
VAIPLETFIHSLRTVLGLAGVALLRFIALVLRVSSSVVRHLGTLTQRLYDLPLFAPLWLEARMKHRRDDSTDMETVSEVRT